MFGFQAMAQTGLVRKQVDGHFVRTIFCHWTLVRKLNSKRKLRPNGSKPFDYWPGI
jgi:hypothetical protein